MWLTETLLTEAIWFWFWQCTLCIQWRGNAYTKCMVNLFPAPFTARTSEACHRPMTHRRLSAWHGRGPAARGQSVHGSVYCAYKWGVSQTDDSPSLIGLTPWRTMWSVCSRLRLLCVQLWGVSQTNDLTLINQQPLPNEVFIIHAIRRGLDLKVRSTYCGKEHETAIPLMYGRIEGRTTCKSGIIRSQSLSFESPRSDCTHECSSQGIDRVEFWGQNDSARHRSKLARTSLKLARLLPAKLEGGKRVASSDLRVHVPRMGTSSQSSLYLKLAKSMTDVVLIDMISSKTKRNFSELIAHYKLAWLLLAVTSGTVNTVRLPCTVVYMCDSS